MQLRIGYELIYSFPQPTPMILVVNVHDSRASDIVVPDHLTAEPSIPITAYRDGFGNQCHRVLAPAGRLRLTADGVIQDSGLPTRSRRPPGRTPVQDLPEDTLVFLLGSRYCETDLLSETAWQLFGGTPPGYARVQAICDYVHQPHRVQLSERPRHAHRRRGFQRTHRRLPRLRASGHRLLPLHEYPGALLHRLPERCRNAAAVSAPGDFAAWFEAWIGGRWQLFDPRNNVPRIGRVLMARGRDASDVAIATTFGPNTLESFRVWTDEIPDAETPGTAADVFSHRAPLHRLPLPRARRPRRTPHDVPPPRESRPAADPDQPGHHAAARRICAGCTIRSTTPSPSPPSRAPRPSCASKAR